MYFLVEIATTYPYFPFYISGDFEYEFWVCNWKYGIKKMGVFKQLKCPLDRIFFPFTYHSAFLYKIKQTLYIIWMKTSGVISTFLIYAVYQVI